MSVRKHIQDFERLVPFGTSERSNHSVLEILQVRDEKIECRCVESGKKFNLYFKQEARELELLKKFVLVQHKPAGLHTVIKIKAMNDQNIWLNEMEYDALEKCIQLSLAPTKAAIAV